MKMKRFKKASKTARILINNCATPPMKETQLVRIVVTLGLKCYVHSVAT